MRRFGIDLGTTNTCISEANFPIGGNGVEDFTLREIDIHYEDEGDMVNPPLESRMPSAIYGVKNDDDSYRFYLGKVAVLMAKHDGVTEIINTKRLLCREDPKTIISYGLTAQDIAQKLLEGCHYSLAMGVRELQRRHASYCITQPAAFGLFASRSIHDAAIRAGFQNAQVQREPIAALLSFLFEQLCDSKNAEILFRKQAEHNGRLLTVVVDIGGGTTDVTIQEIEVTGREEREQGTLFCTGYTVRFLNMVNDDENEDTPIAAANQEPAFGGYDFDKEIVKYVIEEWNRQYREATGEDYNWNSHGGQKAIAELYRRIQRYKDSLSYNPQEIDESYNLDDRFVSCHLTEELVYQITQKLCECGEEGYNSQKTVYGIIVDTIQRSGYNVDDIDYFFVTGGMSSYKPIREIISKRFAMLKNSGALFFSKTPLQDISRGAAVCNCFFKVEMPQTILYADLMIDDPCGEPRVLVKKNEPLPAEDTVPNFMELRNPANLYLDVLWGHSTKDCELKRLRHFRAPLPRGKITPMGTKVSVHYHIDTHQAMDIDLIVHDPDGDYSVKILNLIKNADLIRGE